MEINMKIEITPPIVVRPYDWAHVASLARRYNVHPQVMLDTILSQAHYLPGAIGKEQLRRELMCQALVGDSLDDLDPQEMYHEYLSALGGG